MDKGLLHDLLHQIELEGGGRLLRQCAAALEDLQKELQQQVKINQEQKHLIRILQDSKEYYEQEYRNNSYQAHCQQLAAEATRANALAAAHRKASQELSIAVHQLQERIEQLEGAVAEKDRQLAEKEELVLESQRVVRQVRGEKEVLEVEWNKVVRAVKRKIASLQQKQESREANKENHVQRSKGSLLEGKQMRQEKTRQSESRMQLVERAYRMVAHLEREEAIQEFEGIFLNSQGSSKSSKSSRKGVLKENRLVSALFNSASK